MTRRAFTLMELLVVIAIMGIRGTVSVGGYRAMQRGMEDRGVMQNVNQFIRSAYQRAQIDRLPVNVYFWNETLREESDVETAIVVGKAIAVRRSGRFTKVQGSYLYDEFGDLNYNRLVLDEDDEDGMDASASGSTDQGEGIYLYKISGNEGSQVQRSLVSQTTKRFTTTEPLLLGGQGEMECYAYVLMDSNGVNWQTGDAYGFEFAELELPHGYLFGGNYSRSINNPVAGEDMIRFKVSANSGNGAKGGTDGRSTVTVSSLRPDSSGNLKVETVGTSDSPTKSLY